jgi:signal transduction histidine kinase
VPLPRPGKAGVLLGALVFAGGLVSFLGWALDVPRLTDWLNDGISIQPNTTVLMMLSGAALVALHSGLGPVAGALGGIVAVVGAVMLLQLLTGADFGINHQLLFGRPWGHVSTVTPGQTGPPAAAAFILAGLALAMLGGKRLSAAARRYAAAVGVLIVVIMMFSLTGYLYGAHRLYSIPWLSAIALQTASMFVGIAVGLLLAVPERQPMRLLLLKSGPGELARRLLPLIIVVPPFLGWLRGKGEALGYYDTGTGRALAVVSFIMLTGGLMTWALMALQRREEREEESQQAFRRAQAETAAALIEADRRKDEFLALLSHELRNPLAPVRHAVQVLHLSATTDPNITKARDVIDRQMQQMARLVDDLLDVSRISRGKIELRRERVDLSRVIDGAVEASRPPIEEAGQELIVERSTESLPILGDLTRLIQVFCNLLNNASKFSPRGSRIVVSVGREKGDAVVSVKDSGVGIAPETLPAVFELFMQGDAVAGSLRSGLGIGLTLVKRLVTQHGGTVEARSDGPGCGSEFVVRLPLDGEVLHAPVPSPDGRRGVVPVTVGRVLIVDDNRDAADTVGMMMALVGVPFDTAYDGDEGLRRARELRPDLVLLDIGLPKLNGYDVARAIRGEPWGQSIKLVAMTGWGQESDRVRSLEAGFDLHLVKPVNPDRLIELVTKAPATSA